MPKAAIRRVAVTPPGRRQRRPGGATAYMTALRNCKMSNCKMGRGAAAKMCKFILKNSRTEKKLGAKQKNSELSRRTQGVRRSRGLRRRTRGLRRRTRGLRCRTRGLRRELGSKKNSGAKTDSGAKKNSVFKKKNSELRKRTRGLRRRTTG